jgi:hypothetical protein
VDLFIDWFEKEIDIWLNEDSYIGKTKFYQMTDKECIDVADFVQIYNLKPGTKSFFKDIKVCDSCCAASPGATQFCAGCALRFNLILILGMVAYYIKSLVDN